MLIVLCPVIFMITLRSTPALRMFVLKEIVYRAFNQPNTVAAITQRIADGGAQVQFHSLRKRS